MKGKLIHEKLLSEIIARVPQKATLTAMLTELLKIEREAVYRRLRSQVPFTLDEAINICMTLGISLDQIMGAGRERTGPGMLTLTEYQEETIQDKKELENFIEILRQLNTTEDSETSEATSVLPQTLYYSSPEITRYYLFKWIHQYAPQESKKKYAEVYPSPKLRSLQMSHSELSRNFSQTNYILDKRLFQFIATDIAYLCSINMISPQESRSLKQELLGMTERVEKLAALGRYEQTGKKVRIYVSNIHIDTSFSYMHIGNINTALIKTFLLNAAFSNDQMIVDKFKHWMRMLKRNSVLISESGEMERIGYFDQQRYYINKYL